VEESGSESGAARFSVMSPQARGAETLLPPLRVMLNEIEKLILEMKATGDPHAATSKPASVLRKSSPTRLVVLSNQ
jgi:hypothetical protein